jgi:hypothetical protein
MLNRLIAAIALLALVLLTPTKTTAQVSGVAIAALTQGDALAGFVGPFRPTATGTDIAYIVLCYDTVTRAKSPMRVVASIPDGSGLSGLRTLSTSAIVDACLAEGNISVPRIGVLLPAIQTGQ